MRSPLEDLRDEIATTAAHNRMLRAQLAAVEQERDEARADAERLRGLVREHFDTRTERARWLFEQTRDPEGLHLDAASKRADAATLALLDAVGLPTKRGPL